MLLWITKNPLNNVQEKKNKQKKPRILKGFILFLFFFVFKFHSLRHHRGPGGCLRSPGVAGVVGTWEDVAGAWRSGAEHAEAPGSSRGREKLPLFFYHPGPTMLEEA